MGGWVTGLLITQVVISSIFSIGHFLLWIFLGSTANRKALTLLLAAASFMLVINASWLLTEPGRWNTRKDSVLVQWEWWLSFAFAGAFTGAAAGVYLAARPMWVWMMAVLAAASPLFILFATISGLRSNYVHFIIAAAFWLLLVAANVAVTRRATDAWYWMIWVFAFLGPILFGITWFVGHASMVTIEYELEVGLYVLGAFILFNLLGALMAWTYNGGGIVADARRRLRGEPIQSEQKSARQNSERASLLNGANNGNLKQRKSAAKTMATNV